MLRNLLWDESGQGMAEYGLLIALISIATIASVILIKEGVSAIYHNSGDSLKHPKNVK